MSNYRLATLLGSESITTPGTKIVDLDLSDPISAITIQQKTTSAGTALSDHPAANISKIEVVDGSTVMASLTGKECQALDFHNNKRMPSCFLTDVSGIMTWQTFNLNFGRWLWDTLYALNPLRYQNPQLKITHNYRAADASASACTLEVYAHAFDKKKITPEGFLSPKEHHSYTCGASGTIEYIELPRDYAIRQLLIRAAAADYYPWQVANKFKINENGGASIPYEVQVSAWLKHINQIYPRIQEPACIAVNDTARDIYVCPSWQIGVNLVPITVTNIISQEAANPAVPFKLDITSADNCTGMFTGVQPHGCFPIPFGDQEDPLDWYNVSELDKLKIEITAGTAGTNGSVQVVTEQLMKY